MNEDKIKYLNLLAEIYPTIGAAATEIVNLNAIRRLPKGTEYFFSDLHGEYEGFRHLLRSASGIIMNKISEQFENTITTEEQKQLARLVYYPEAVINALKKLGKLNDDWKRITIYRLMILCKTVASKYTRSHVRKRMPKEQAYAMDELLHADYNVPNKASYYNEIIHSIVEVGEGETFIVAMCNLIQNLCVNHLHIIGDIFDRGPRPDLIMNELIRFGEVDIQWGNHDISWIGAACGNEACICNVVRIALSYNCFDLLEDGYGINLRPLSMFAADVYSDDRCNQFVPKLLDENRFDIVKPELSAKMHKAITIIQLKLEGQLIKRHPEYEMDNRILLEHIDFASGTVMIDGVKCTLSDTSFPTVNKDDPLELTDGERRLLKALKASFLHSELLHEHVSFLYSHGSMYRLQDANLLYHGCIPMNEDGSFMSMRDSNGNEYAGRKLVDWLDKKVQSAYFLPADNEAKQDAVDIMWYLWCGSKSPVFGKSKQAMFEHKFVKEDNVKEEVYNSYYSLTREEEICNRILEEFGMNTKNSHIINGHVPVKAVDGENPVKANGKLYVIDGGLSKAYQAKTGIAGYTLIYNSANLVLAEHSTDLTTEEGEMSVDINQRMLIVEQMEQRVMIADTYKGKRMENKISELYELITAYKEGIIKEKL